MKGESKPRGDSPLNRLSRKRQNALFEFAGVHTPAETVAWLREKSVTTADSAVGNWMSIERLRRQLRLNGAAVQTLVETFQSVSEAEGQEWDAEQIQRLGQAFFSAMAVQQQDPRIWNMTQRLALQKEQLTFEQSKFKESLRTKLQMGLEALAEAFRETPPAMRLYEQARALIDTETK
jgi:hypothetical protein